MTASQMASLYVANQEARRHKALMASIYTPAVKEAIDRYTQTVVPPFEVTDAWKKQMEEITAKQFRAVIPRYDIPRPLIEVAEKQFSQQNETIAKILKVHGSLGSAAFKVPEGLAESVAAWREHLEAEGAPGDDISAADHLWQLADERQRIVTCIARCAAVFEACRCFGIEVPPVLCGLVLVAYVLGEVANDVLNERN